MIHLRGQGLILCIRRIWSIEPYKSPGDFEAEYDYLEDVEQQAVQAQAREDETKS
jgi:hypothetical protein